MMESEVITFEDYMEGREVQGNRKGGSMTTTPQAPVATMEIGGYYDFNFAAAPGGSGTFEGWTDFGWMIFTNEEGETRFYNTALLCTLRRN